MTSMKIFRPKTRLRELVSAAGGMRALEAVAAAEVRLEVVSQTCLAGVDSKIEELTELSAQRTQGCEDDQVARVYRLSNEIFAESGAFGRTALSTAARSLCDLTSGAVRDGTIWNSIDVHVQSMRVLRRGDVESSSEMCKAVLEGLRKVASRAS